MKHGGYHHESSESDDMIVMERFCDKIPVISKEDKANGINEPKERYQEVKETRLKHDPVEDGSPLLFCFGYFLILFVFIYASLPFLWARLN